MTKLFSDKRRIFDGNIAKPVVADREIAIPSRDFNRCDIHFGSIKGAASADIDPVIAAIFSIENKPINQPQNGPLSHGGRLHFVHDNVRQLSYVLSGSSIYDDIDAA